MKKRQRPKKVVVKVAALAGISGISGIAPAIKLPTFECTRCGHHWHPKKEEKPRCCGFCKSSYWDKPVDKESEVKARHVKECTACKVLVDVAG